MKSKGKKYKDFVSIHIEGSGDKYGYCSSHNFIYDKMFEKWKLSLGLPCFYTDKRYRNYREFSDNDVYLHCDFSMYNTLSLNECIQKVNDCGNIPVGTEIIFESYLSDVSSDVKFKVEKFNRYEPNYEISNLAYSRLFHYNKERNAFIEFLRNNKFLVEVTIDEDGDGSALAYGNGMIIGFSDGEYKFGGSEVGDVNIFYRKFDDYTKWRSGKSVLYTDNYEDILLNMNK